MAVISVFSDNFFLIRLANVLKKTVCHMISHTEVPVWKKSPMSERDITNDIQCLSKAIGVPKIRKS